MVGLFFFLNRAFDQERFGGGARACRRSSTNHGQELRRVFGGAGSAIRSDFPPLIRLGMI